MGLFRAGLGGAGLRITPSIPSLRPANQVGLGLPLPDTLPFWVSPTLLLLLWVWGSGCEHRKLKQGCISLPHDGAGEARHWDGNGN